SDIPDPAHSREPETTSEMLEEMAEEGFSLSDERIAAIRVALDEDDPSTIKALLDDLGEADMADLLHKFDAPTRHIFLAKHSDLIDPYVFVLLDGELRDDILSDMPPREVARIVSDLDSDDALELIIDLDPAFQKEILQKLSAKNR